MNNAAAIEFGTTIDKPNLLEIAENQFELNVFAPLELTRLCTPELVNTKGSIVNVTSVNGVKAVSKYLARH